MRSFARAALAPACSMTVPTCNSVRSIARLRTTSVPEFSINRFRIEASPGLEACNTGCRHGPDSGAGHEPITIPVGGKFTSKQREIYEIVLAANNCGRELTKPGETYLSVHLAAAEVIASGLKALGLMKGDVQEAVRSGAHALFMPHGLGHMLGMDVHDMENLGENHVGYDDEIHRINQFGTAYLRLGRRLKPGFVVTNEPGIYFIPALIEKWKAENINAGFINFDRLESYLDFGGIRLEDDILVTETGCEIIGDRIPVTPDEVEDVMR